MYAKNTERKSEEEVSPFQLKIENRQFAETCNRAHTNSLTQTNPTPKTFRLGTTVYLSALTELEWRRFQAKRRQDRGFEEWRKQAKLGPIRDSPFKKKQKPPVVMINPTPTQRSILEDLESHKIVQNVLKDKIWLRQRSRPVETDQATTPPGQKLTHGRKLLLKRLEIARLEQASANPPIGGNKELVEQSRNGHHSTSQTAHRDVTDYSNEYEQIQQELLIIQASLEKLQTRLTDLVMHQ